MDASNIPHKLPPLILIIFVMLLGAWAPAAKADDWRYTIRPGDHLWDLSIRFCRSASRASEIATYNNLNLTEPLKAGTRINIPVDWLYKRPAPVKVISHTGQVSAQLPDGSNATVELGLALPMGSRISTQEGSVTVRFADDSELEIAAQSEVMFTLLTAFGDMGMVDADIEFSQGRGTARIVRRESGSRYQIRTPSGIAAVRGTEFRVGVVGENSLTEIQSGEVAFSERRAGAPTSDIALPAGFGVVANAAGAQKESLLEAPQWQSNGATVSPSDVLIFSEVQGADAYRVKLYQQDGMLLSSDVQLKAAMKLPRLPAGGYRATVRAVAVTGLEGLESERGFAVVLPKPALLSSSSIIQGDAFRWRDTVGPFEITYTSENEGAQTLVATSDTLDTSTLAPGTYSLTIKDAAGSVSQTDVVISPQPPPPDTPRWPWLLFVLPLLAL